MSEHKEEGKRREAKIREQKHRHEEIVQTPMENVELDTQFRPNVLQV